MTATSSNLRDFRAYGRLEAFNAVLIPSLATYFGWTHNFASGAVLVLANLGVFIGLLVGTLYWLALADRVNGNASPMDGALRIASASQRPMLVMIVAATIGLIAMVAARGWSLSAIVSAIVTALAGLEYVNYYHVQLQHFDNASDWRRLRDGRGFRQAHLARDLAKWRRSR
ncbi:MAG: hypothetical protein ABIR63_07065 [Sphingomicrobium sp.]